MLLHLDIETLPTELPEIVAELSAAVRPPGNMSTPATIAKWEAEKKPALVEEAIRKTSFDATYGRVCCIGWAFEDAQPDTLMTPAHTEGDILLAFCQSVQAHAGKIESRLEIVGHNVSWDLRFLLQRCIVTRVKPPHILMAAMLSKPWGDAIRDTMLMWHPERERRISLDGLCKVLGVPSSKGDMDGSKVYDAYRNGEFEKIAAYCRADVETTRNIFKRLTFT